MRLVMTHVGQVFLVIYQIVFCVCVAGCRVNSTSSSNSVYNVNSSQSLSSYNLSPLPAGPAAGAGAISMAAAQAVQATAQVKPPPLPLFVPLLPSLPVSTIFGLLGAFFPHVCYFCVRLCFPGTLPMLISAFTSTQRHYILFLKENHIDKSCNFVVFNISSCFVFRSFTKKTRLKYTSNCNKILTLNILAFN